MAFCPSVGGVPCCPGPGERTGKGPRDQRPGQPVPLAAALFCLTGPGRLPRSQAPLLLLVPAGRSL